jgi:hypothetical protein
LEIEASEAAAYADYVNEKSDSFRIYHKSPTLEREWRNPVEVQQEIEDEKKAV